jgi:hypothetical protein
MTLSSVASRELGGDKPTTSPPAKPDEREIPGQPDYRTRVTRTRLTYAVAVCGQLSPGDGDGDGDGD